LGLGLGTVVAFGATAFLETATAFATIAVETAAALAAVVTVGAVAFAAFATLETAFATLALGAFALEAFALRTFGTFATFPTLFGGSARSGGEDVELRLLFRRGRGRGGDRDERC
jgi:hypothetical protein